MTCTAERTVYRIAMGGERERRMTDLYNGKLEYWDRGRSQAPAQEGRQVL